MKYQLNLIRIAMTNETIILGDFNIDFRKRYMVDYVSRYLFEDFDDALSNFGLEQLVNFVTWSRLVNNVLKSSTLDHIYRQSPVKSPDIKTL